MVLVRLWKSVISAGGSLELNATTMNEVTAALKQSGIDDQEEINRILKEVGEDNKLTSEELKKVMGDATTSVSNKMVGVAPA